MRITSLDDINSWVRSWMQEKWVHKIIAFSWSSSNEKLPGIPDELAKQVAKANQEYVDAIISGALDHLADYRVAILTGGTWGWVPESATRKAKELWMSTIWVYPESRSKKDALGDTLLDCAIEVGSVFGKSMFWDESTVFAKLADATVILGWNAGTLVEVSHALKLNESLLEVRWNGEVKLKNENEHQKHILPVIWIPGISPIVKLLPGKSYVKDWTFPTKDIRTGKDIFDYLRLKLNLDEILTADNKK